MATDTIASVPSIASPTMTSPDFETVTGVDHREKLQAAEDDKSSSLSELGDRAAIEHSSSAPSEANDTEAETERLDDSPQKQRRQQDVVLTSTKDAYGSHQEHSVAEVLPQKNCSLGSGSEDEKLEQTSDISSLGDSCEESGQESSPLSIPMKRKHSIFEEDSADDPDIVREASPKVTEMNDNNAVEASATLDAQFRPGVSVVGRDLKAIADTTISSRNEKQPMMPQVVLNQKNRKGKRKGKRTMNNEPTNADNAGSGLESTTEHSGNPEALLSNEEDVQIENMAEGVEAENPNQLEELIEKKSAMESLNAIETYFARLRDKIYEERIAQCNQELAVLEQPVPIHQELLAMKEVIDRRRDQKIEYENDLMKFRLMTLQRVSIANKAQTHSQYMQTVREIRDSYLESLNKEYYQVQRERRNCEGDVPDYIYTFTAKRSQQITHQSAYNTEVSILAGVAKYVGFPAAPEICSARSNEIDDDFRSMGIAASAMQNAQNHHVALMANLSATTNFPRQRPGAEEHFLEQNPWANPQHPAHHQQRMSRQVSGLSRALARSSTPAGQRRLVDLTEPTAEPQSMTSSSVGPTLTIGEASKSIQSGQMSEMSESVVDSIPSKLVDGSPLNSRPVNLGLPDSSRYKSDKTNLPTLPRSLSLDNQTPSALPKPLPFFQAGSSTPGFRTSTPARYTVIKAEDPRVGSRQSPLPLQLHGTAPVSTASDGQANRFAA